METKVIYCVISTQTYLLSGKVDRTVKSTHSNRRLAERAVERYQHDTPAHLDIVYSIKEVLHFSEPEEEVSF